MTKLDLWEDPAGTAGSRPSSAGSFISIQPRCRCPRSSSAAGPDERWSGSELLVSGPAGIGTGGVGVDEKGAGVVERSSWNRWSTGVRRVRGGGGMPPSAGSWAALAAWQPATASKATAITREPIEVRIAPNCLSLSALPASLVVS